MDKTFQQIASYLKKDGIFVFSWSHPIHKCVSMKKNTLIFRNSYINVLAKAGFVIEQLVEESDEDIISQSKEDDFAKKAKMLPVTFVIKARKL